MIRVLIVDDDIDIVNALKIYLRPEGYNLLEAHNGEEALNLIQKEQVDLILMDIMMPKMDGVTAVSRLREFSNVPVILLTAKSEDSGTYVFENRGIYLVIGKAEAEGATINAVRDMMYEVEADAKKSKENTIVSPVKTETLISQKYITLTYCTKNEDSSPTYTQYLLTAENDYLYMITVVYPEQFYSNDSREKIRSICGSISFNG